MMYALTGGQLGESLNVELMEDLLRILVEGAHVGPVNPEFDARVEVVTIARTIHRVERVEP